MTLSLQFTRVALTSRRGVRSCLRGFTQSTNHLQYHSIQHGKPSVNVSIAHKSVRSPWRTLATHGSKMSETKSAEVDPESILLISRALEDSFQHHEDTQAAISNTTTALTKIGVRHPSDLMYLKEDELIAASRGHISPIAARKIIATSATKKVVLNPPTALMLTLPQVTQKVGDVGIVRGQRSLEKVFVSSALGAAYLGFGGMMLTLVAGGTPLLAETLPGLHSLMGAAVFPAGLMLITLSGTEMITANFMLHGMPFFTHPDRTKQNISDVLRIWPTSTLGNMIGGLSMAAAASCIFVAEPFTTFAVALAVKKATAPALLLFGKAVGANWLVNVAITAVNAVESLGAKAIAIWIPITTFVALGLEHAVANMFLIPFGMLLGADVSVSQYLFGNLVPVLAGNGVGAVVFLCACPYFLHLKK
eukprot:m.62970 g.62970  ORF g.62970 m.62970 type:complete len:420 (-) comp23223_c1_seq1:64-1323(-)